MQNDKLDFKQKMKQIVALVHGLKAKYNAASGSSLRRGRRLLQQAAGNSTLLNLVGFPESTLLFSSPNISNAFTLQLSSAMASAMTTVTTEANKAGVNLADPETAGAVVNFFASVAPVAASTGAVSATAAKSGAELLMAVLSKNPGLQAGLAGLLSALPATSSEAASIRAQTSAALSKVSTQRVALAFYNADTKAWDTSCGLASASATAGVYSGKCNHLTPFALLSYSGSVNANGSYWPNGIGASFVYAPLVGLLFAALSSAFAAFLSVPW
eukprot:tig00020824_g14237.t1